MALISRKSFQFCSSSTPTSRSLLMTLNKRLSFLSGQQKPENCNFIAMRMVCFKNKPRYMFWRKKHVQMQIQSLNETLPLCGDTGSPAKSNTAWMDEELFFKKLNSLCTSKEIFCFLSSLEVMSDTMASGALQRISEIEVDDSGLKNPEGVLENEIFRALCFQFEFESSKLSNTGLLNAVQALVKLRIDPQSTLVASLLSEGEERLSKGQLSVENLCALGESLLELESPSYATLEQIMNHMQKKDIEKWSPREMVLVYRILQVIVKEGKKQYQDLLNRLNNVTLTIVSQLTPKFTSIILNSLVILDQTQAVPLVTALCKHSVKHIPYFMGDELVDILDAFLYFGYHEQIFTEALETYVPKSIFTMHPQTVSKVMQYCCQKRILSKPIFDAVAESFISHGDRFTADQIAGYIVPFGTLNYLPPSASSLFRKLETILHARLSQFQPRTLLNLLHSCVLIQRYPVNFLPKIFSPYFLQRLQAQPPGLDRIATSQLIHLFLTVTLECPFYEGPKLLPKYQVKSFLMPRTSLDVHLLKRVKTGLLHLLKKRMYFASEVSTPYFYVVDIEIKLDEEGFVLPAAQREEVDRRIALCVDGQYRFCINSHHCLGEEAIKQRHLQLLGYEVVQIPFFEIESLRNRREVAEYLHKKLSPLIHRDSAANRGE